jgi:hypothetical protein
MEAQPTPVQVCPLARLEFDLTDGDLRIVYEQYYRAAYKADRDHLTRWQRRWRWALFGGSSIALFLSLWVRMTTPEVPLLFIGLWLFLAWYALASLRDQRPARERQAGRATAAVLSSAVIETLVGRWAVQLLPDGVRADGPGEDRFIRWCALWGFHLDEHFVRIATTDSRGVIIPLRAFASPTAAQHLFKTGSRPLPWPIKAPVSA